MCDHFLSTILAACKVMKLSLFPLIVCLWTSQNRLTPIAECMKNFQTDIEELKCNICIKCAVSLFHFVQQMGH